MLKNERLSIHKGSSLKSVLTELETAAMLSFEDSVPIPAAVNHSKEFFTHELKSIFLKEWISVGREDEISNEGDFLTHEVAGVSILIVRQTNGSISSFINACAHRFARLVQEKSGNTKRFMCPYHAWTYNIGCLLYTSPSPRD